VHVKGTWLPLDGSTQPVLASEIELQDGDDSSALSCVAGAKAEVEGNITAKSTTLSTITVSQQGKGLFECAVSASTSIRKGNKSCTFAELGLGWQVHVKGMAQGLSATGACKVTASEVMVQRD
jgi:hypothetical protein